MRSLFHFPFPCTQPPSQQPSHCSQKCAIARILHPCAASAAPQRCFPPPPAPGPWLARIALHASPFSQMREKGPLPGNIFAPCIHFRAQSGDSGCMTRESCRQGPSFASGNPKSRMARRCCQRRPAFPRQRHAAWPNGLCAMRQRHATRSMAERALRPAARAWPACRMRAPCHLACARRRPRSSPPSYTRRASPPASRPRTPPSAAPPITVGMSCRSGSSCRPRAVHADASRHLRAAPIPPAARTHRVQETSGTTQTTQCGHKNRIPEWGSY